MPLLEPNFVASMQVPEPPTQKEGFKPTLQVLSVTLIQASSSSNSPKPALNSNSQPLSQSPSQPQHGGQRPPRYRLALSDGSGVITGLLVTQLAEQMQRDGMRRGSVVRLDQYMPNNSNRKT